MFLVSFFSILIRQIIRFSAFFLIDLYLFLKRLYGTDKAISMLLPIMDFIGRSRSKFMARLARVDVQDMSSMGKIQDMEDKIFGVRGVWERKDKDISIKIERFCPFAEKLKGNPEFCLVLVKRFEESTFKVLNESYSLEVEGKLLSEHKGEGCVFLHRLNK